MVRKINQFKIFLIIFTYDDKYYYLLRIFDWIICMIKKHLLDMKQWGNLSEYKHVQYLSIGGGLPFLLHSTTPQRSRNPRKPTSVKVINLISIIWRRIWILFRALIMSEANFVFRLYIIICHINSSLLESCPFI